MPARDESAALETASETPAEVRATVAWAGRDGPRAAEDWRAPEGLACFDSSAERAAGLGIGAATAD